ncbi:MAG: polyketide synthase dehydratase domain-containing protein, partial [Verrucomicrobia bacterium]|nr:polyketide synthase dehydratase domain-containing protein [Verrucomicrobiota bacterium]
KGTNTGVFMGICFNDYGQLITQSGDIDAVDDYYSTGNHFSVTAGRISYILGLQGPAMALDTACSSSLVAVDIACEKIRSGECELALAGGVNLILAPESTINFCKSNMLAEDGRCKTFDAAANGYVRGEGCGIVVLKKLKDALRDNNPVLAVIRATAVNQDGASTGLTVPNVQAQELLINKALRRANLEAREIDYVEAHGTGTSLGDPIEVKGIVATYGQNRNKPLIIGSAKTNIGHTEAAAGVAGLIKCTLALKYGEIPKHLHFHKLNPFITMDETQVKVASEAVDWPEGKKKRYAAVSSFGFSGTNSHIIIEEAPKHPERQSSLESKEYLLTLSAKSEKALNALIQDYVEYLECSADSLGDITYTANSGRTHFEFRVAVSGKTNQELVTKLKNSDFTVSTELETIAKKYLSGETIDWSELYKSSDNKIVSVPNYPFQRQRYWSQSARPQIGKKIAAIHPLVGEVHTNPREELFFLGQLHLSLLAYLKDHLVYKYLIYPAAAYLEMLLAAGKYAFDSLSIQLKSVAVEAALSFPEGKAVDTQIVMSPIEEGYDVSIFSLSDNKNWKSHVRAKVSQRNQREEPKKVDIESIRQRCQTILPKIEFYKYAHSVGLCIGPAFHTLQNIYVSDTEGLGEVKLPHNEAEYIAHPALLDGCLQLLFVLAWRAGSESLYLPISFDTVELYAPLGDHVFAHWIQGEVTDDGRVGALTICTPSGDVVAKIDGVRFRKTNESALTQMIAHKTDVKDWLYKWTWH